MEDARLVGVVTRGIPALCRLTNPATAYLLLDGAAGESGLDEEEKDLILGTFRSETEGTGEGEGMGDCLREFEDLDRFILDTIF